MRLRLLTALGQTASRQGAEASDFPRSGLLKRAIGHRTTLLGALFIFAYQGAEVSISGWVISFLINYRNGDAAQVGYVTAGFWTGITLGRFLLVQPASKVGERVSVYALIVGAAAFQLLIWLVPNIIGNAVAVSLVGLLLGAGLPMCNHHFQQTSPSQYSDEQSQLYREHGQQWRGSSAFPYASFGTEAWYRCASSYLYWTLYCHGDVMDAFAKGRQALGMKWDMSQSIDDTVP